VSRIYIFVAAVSFALSAGPASAQTIENGTTVPAMVSSPVPDMPNLEPMIHRLAIDTHMQGPLATALKITEDGKSWRCRQVFLDFKSEPGVRHWIAQGFDDPDDLMYSRTENDHYVAIHIKSNGQFVTAVSIDDVTGKGVRLGFLQASAMLDHDVAAWNAATNKY
jgi:hypothetical protein